MLSYDDEVPYPESGTHWEKPEGEPCPGCDCCSRRLCTLAADRRTSCALQADDPRRVAGCPCSEGARS